MENSTFVLTDIEAHQILEANAEGYKRQILLKAPPQSTIEDIISMCFINGTPIKEGHLAHRFITLVYNNYKSRYNNCASVCTTFMFSPVFPKDIKRVISRIVWETHRDPLWNA